ncbi:MAG: hypothetical protein KC414_14305, partial [Romboutsia sp.]|nr:hypothetical protein [Romboutsia sp.]
SGEKNTFIGSNSGYYNTTGLNNIFIGPNSGFVNTTGDNNTYIGLSTGLTITSGDNNTILGAYAGSGGGVGLSGCILLGYQAGQTNTTNNRLMIDNSNTNTPLVDGSFSSNTLQINGTTTIGQTSNTSHVHAIWGEIFKSTTGPSGIYLRIDVNGDKYLIALDKPP